MLSKQQTILAQLACIVQPEAGVLGSNLLGCIIFLHASRGGGYMSADECMYALMLRRS